MLAAAAAAIAARARHRRCACICVRVTFATWILQIKHDRDTIRAENSTRRQQRGLVSSEDLLLDFEKRRQDIITAKEDLERAKAHHRHLSEQSIMFKRVVASN